MSKKMVSVSASGAYSVLPAIFYKLLTTTKQIMRHIVYMKVHFELMKCINDQLTRAKHASRSAAEASINNCCQ